MLVLVHRGGPGRHTIIPISRERVWPKPMSKDLDGILPGKNYNYYTTHAYVRELEEYFLDAYCLDETLFSSVIGKHKCLMITHITCYVEVQHPLNGIPHLLNHAYTEHMYIHVCDDSYTHVQTYNVAAYQQ